MMPVQVNEMDEIEELKNIETEQQKIIADDHWFMKVIKLTVIFALLFGALLWLASYAINSNPCWHTDDTNDCRVI